MRVATALVLALLLAASGGAQNTSFSAQVVSGESREPLPYAIVIMPTLSREQFANDSGVFIVGNVPSGPLQLRIRRLGFQPLDTIIDITPTTGRIRIALRRVVTQLAAVTVRAHAPCKATDLGRPLEPALAEVVGQIKMNADQYDLLVRKYPVIYTMEITESSRMKSDGHVRVEVIYDQPQFASKVWKYKRGEMVSRVGRDYAFNVPTVMALSNDEFLQNHCFHYAGMTTDSLPLIRVDVVASEDLKEPDINGQIYVDPTNFQIRRTVFELSRRPRLARDLLDFEVTTEFKEVIPSISLINFARSVQTWSPTSKRRYDQSYEEHRLIEYTFLKDKP